MTEKDLFNQKNDWREIKRNDANRYRVEFDSLYSGTYTLYIRDSYGCVFEMDELLVPYDEDIFIPNIFTPNGDGVNDAFYIRNLPSEGTQLIVSNRNGTKVYENKDYTIDSLWDGGDLPDGIYFYNMKLPGGQTFKGWVEIWRGTKP